MTITVWIPTKAQIEDRIERLLRTVRDAKNLSDIQDTVANELSELECHIYNRALEEVNHEG